MENTKQRILSESLKLFSQNGYEAVSVDQIAKAVGIKAPSLYKHYKSKQDIFDAIFAEMRTRYDEQTAAMNLHISKADSDTELFENIGADELVERVTNLIKYSIEDEYVSQFRKLMTIEQFRSPEMAALYTERYVLRMLNYHEKLFEILIENGTLIKGNTKSMAWEFVSPVLVLLSICDREPNKKDEAFKELEAHIRQFYAIYHNKEKDVK